MYKKLNQFTSSQLCNTIYHNCSGKSAYFRSAILFAELFMAISIIY